jgi:predicted small lipoprotein YifL
MCTIFQRFALWTLLSLIAGCGTVGPPKSSPAAPTAASSKSVAAKSAID